MTDIQTDLHIVEGENLTRNELKSRLNQMDIVFNPNNQKKIYFVGLYNEAVKNAENREKILEKLKRDTESYNERRNKRVRDTSEDAAHDLKVDGKKSKVEKDEENLGSSNNLKIISKGGKKEEEKNSSSDVINFADLIPKKEEKEKEVSNPEVIENSPNVDVNNPITTTTQKKGITTAKIFIGRSQDKSSSNSIKLLTIPENEPINFPNFKPEIKSETLNKIKEHAHSQHTQNIQAEEVSKFPNINPLILNRYSDNQKNNISPVPEASKLNINPEKAFTSKSVPQNPDEQTGSKDKISSFTSNSNNINNLKINLAGLPTNNIKTNYFPSQNNKPPSKMRSTTSGHFHSHTNFPKMTGEVSVSSRNSFYRENLKNELFKQELEKAKKVSSQSESRKTLNYVGESSRDINGGVELQNAGRTEGVYRLNLDRAGVQSQSEKPSNTNLLNPNPFFKNENGINKWVVNSNPSGFSIKNICKYLIAAVVASVMFYGLYYCIQNCPALSFENLGFTKLGRGNVEGSYPGTNFKVGDFKIPGMDTTETLNNLTNNVSSNIKDKISENTNSFKAKIGEFFSPLSSIFWALTNPREFLWENFKKFAFDIAWGYFKRNIWYFLGIFVLKTIAFKAYSVFMNRRNAAKIYKTVKDRLRSIYDSSNHYEGLTEDEIIREYSKEYEMKEEYFRNQILPKIKEMRREDGEVREFETYSNGRNRLAWQYVGFC